MLQAGDAHDRENPHVAIKRIKNAGAQIKRELSRFQTFLSKGETDNHPVELIQVRYDAIKPILEKFNSVQSQFEELILESNPDIFCEEEANNEWEEFEEKYFKQLVLAETILKRSAPSCNAANAHCQAPAGNPIPTGWNTLQHVAAKLPQLSLPEFSGVYSDWHRFRDMFLAIVHNNSGLSNVQRFYYLEAALKDRITGMVPQTTFNISGLNIPEELKLADPAFNMPSKIDMLIGASVFFELLSIGQFKLGKNLPILQKTILGWIITGRITSAHNEADSFLSQCLMSKMTVERQLEKFWEVEEVPIESNEIKYSQEEIDCRSGTSAVLEIHAITIHFVPKCRLEMQLPEKIMQIILKLEAKLVEPIDYLKVIIGNKTAAVASRVKM
ncbi:hypothetical protein HUJ05_001297 [Dendroctonus ponderosae]|nr:hypothetical protein HUJ05_001297 [Dendroctonus ponderosae]